MIRILVILFLGAVCHAQENVSCLMFEDIEVREEMSLFVAGCAANAEKVAFTTERGDVWMLENSQWKRFALGLREPSRIVFKDNGQVLVRQSVETTLISDRDRDGMADEYMAVDPEAISDFESISPFKGIEWLEGPEKSGLFKGQYFGGSRSGNYISRLTKEEDELGTHYGLFVFQKGLVYPVDAMTRVDERTWVVAQSNRSDPDRTRDKSAVQRAVWNGNIPFEVVSARATKTGIKLGFNKELLIDSATSEYSYRFESLADQKELKIVSVRTSEDNKSVTIECDPLSQGDMYHISFEGVWSSERDPVRNPACLFTWK